METSSAFASPIAPAQAPAANHRFLVTMAYGATERTRTEYYVCSMEVGAWVLKPFDAELAARGVMRTEEMLPDCIFAALVASGDWPADRVYHLEVDSADPSNDRAAVVRGEAQFDSILKLFQYLNANGLELVGEFSGLVY